MLMPGRHANTADYRYGFQGQEMDDEIKGEGNSLNYTFRMHDPRVGRFFAVDPLTKKYPDYSPYSFGGNKVIAYTELEGEEEVSYVEKLDYNGDAFDYLIAVPNAAITINNSVNVIWNSGVATVKKIYHDGIFGYGKAVAQEAVATGEGITDSTKKLYDYTVNTPAKQQLKNLGDKVSSPEFFEGSLAFIAEAYVGSKFIGPELPVKNKSPKISSVDDIPQIIKNKSSGDVARDNIAKRFPGARKEVTANTTDGIRYIDVLTSEGIAIESKVGRTSLTKSIRRQLDKDVELLNDPTSGVNSVRWEFSRSSTTGEIGPTAPLKAELEKNGIEIIINE
ncbi:RHS repeat-associated core domain-containing protein [Aequorivita antarctica]|uniref:RHS repeat-associated core domain-containing protein n=1 Tax=Aequorivita antarctica TaxID=153266 RepID=A0A5C6YWN5_9FLAO|nr:RHS repeat-associated core domain-containing protein [Aequorivita antarctica]TXD71585.1 hypothetical protein ESU54_16310 [Aequorivita antarctica]SRX75270.1 hypothetical protein AEQU3_02264 [Aequorivita antarctica]